MTSRISKRRSGTSGEKSSGDDLLDSAAAAYRAAQKPKCVTCQDPKVREVIRDYVKRVDAGTLALPVPGLLGVLRGEKYRYPHSLNALYRHIRQCERGRG
jgi:hypothetical protein